MLWAGGIGEGLAGLSKTLRAIARQASEVSGLNITAEIDEIDGLFPDETEINIRAPDFDGWCFVLNAAGYRVWVIFRKTGTGKGIDTVFPDSDWIHLARKPLTHRLRCLLVASAFER